MSGLYGGRIDNELVRDINEDVTSHCHPGQLIATPELYLDLDLRANTGECMGFIYDKFRMPIVRRAAGSN